jgi:hypothetical protein
MAVQPQYAPPVSAVGDPYGHIPYGVFVSKSEYIKNYASETVNKSLKTAAITCYVLIVINLLAMIGMVAGLGLDTSYLVWSVVELGIWLVLTLGMHLGKSRICAYGMLVMAIIGFVISAAQGQASGVLWAISAASAVTAFNKADKEYKAFAAARGMQG